MAEQTPRADGLRAMREAKFDMNQRRMKEEQGKTVERPKPTVKKMPAKIGRKRG